VWTATEIHHGGVLFTQRLSLAMTEENKWWLTRFLLNGKPSESSHFLRWTKLHTSSSVLFTYSTCSTCTVHRDENLQANSDAIRLLSTRRRERNSSNASALTLASLFEKTSTGVVFGGFCAVQWGRWTCWARWNNMSRWSVRRMDRNSLVVWSHTRRHNHHNDIKQVMFMHMGSIYTWPTCSTWPRGWAGSWARRSPWSTRYHHSHSFERAAFILVTKPQLRGAEPMLVCTA